MPRTKGKKPLSQENILSAALKYADKEGIESLSIRQLAGLLDAGAMSLYHYFDSRDKLLDAMVEFVAGKIYRPTPKEPWREALTHIAVSAYQMMLKHEWVCDIWSKRTLGPNKLGFMESILKVLREGGFSVADACDAYHAITAHIEGFALQTSGFPIKPKDLQLAAARFLESVQDPDSIPYFVEHVQHHLDHPESPDQFGMMLNMILDGFEARLAEKYGDS
ncbi:MAG: TetR/AcrR family transcriptional regulator [Pseudomonadota bacterium]